MDQTCSTRRQRFRPFWPNHASPPREAKNARMEDLSDQLKNTESQQHEEVRHTYLWKLMHNYIPAKKDCVQESFVNHIEYTIARSRFNFDNFSAYLACSYSVRDRLIELFNDTQEYFIAQKAKQVYYVCMEFLVGRFLRNALQNLELEDLYRDSLKELDISLDTLFNEEYDPGLGNGGLGRLAACFMDSMATLNLPAWGYGLMYSFGIFKQIIGPDGSQLEIPDYWLNYGDPWRVQKDTVTYPIGFFGHVKDGKWIPGQTIIAMANDFLIPGFATDNTLALRLWSSKPSSELDEEKFRYGDYYEAVTGKQKAENLTSVLYPNDNTYEGKEMRLMQEYFLSAATLKDIIRRLKKQHKADIRDLPKYAAIQLNDTHPNIMVAELLRILIDEENIPFTESYEICKQVFSYACHTLMPEALEKWSLSLFEKVLPRHIEIIYELNQLFLDQLRFQYKVDDDVIRDLSIIEEGDEKKVKMANLAVIGSHAINGVAKIHSDLMKKHVFNNFYQIWPEKFQNKTNGVTVRRWLHHCNQELSNLITKVVGNQNWALNAEGLAKLMTKIDDPQFCQEWSAIKRNNKQRFANWVKENLKVNVIPDLQIFDVQVKRIHEYKRQTLNILSVIYRYLRIIDGDTQGMHPRAIFIGGKAAPGYYFAKKVIKLINNVANVINNDPKVGDLLKLLYIPNYNVSLAEMIIPASDINEQISTAGYEASGTSNMKFAFNSSLIVGTWDGANIEIGEEIGNENVFFFGTKSEDVDKIRSGNGKNISKKLDRVFKAIKNGMFGANEYQCIIDSVYNGDYYLCGQDFDMFIDIQEKVDRAYRDKDKWTKMGIKSTANMAKFSSDRTIHEYATEIWNIHPCPLPQATPNEGEGSYPANSQPIQQQVGSMRRHNIGSMHEKEGNTPMKGGFGSLPRGGHQSGQSKMPSNHQKNESSDDGGIPIE